MTKTFDELQILGMPTSGVGKYFLHKSYENKNVQLQGCSKYMKQKVVDQFWLF